MLGSHNANLEDEDEEMLCFHLFVFIISASPLRCHFGTQNTGLLVSRAEEWQLYIYALQQEEKPVSDHAWGAVTTWNNIFYSFQDRIRST